jgi:hypothetical protein
MFLPVAGYGAHGEHLNWRKPNAKLQILAFHCPRVLRDDCSVLNGYMTFMNAGYTRFDPMGMAEWRFLVRTRVLCR